MTRYAAQDYSLTVPTGQEITLNVSGEYVRCVYSNQDDFQIGLDAESTTFFAQGCETRIPAGSEFFRTLRIKNNNGSDLTVRLIVGYGTYKDDRLQQSGTVQAEITNPEDIKLEVPDRVSSQSTATLASGASAIIVAGNSLRDVLYVSNCEPIGGTTIWVGNSFVNINRGIPIPPQGVLPLQTTDGLYGRQDSGSSVSVAFLQTERT